MTTQVNTYEKNLKSAKIGTLQVDRLKVGRGWQTYVPTLAQGAVGTHATNLVANDWRYKIENNTLHIQGHIQKTGACTGELPGASTYTFTLPTGCTPRFPGTATTLYGVGRIAINSTTGPVYYQGYAICTSTVFSFVIGKNDTAEAAWSNASAAAILLDSAALRVGATLAIELDPTCAALAGNPVP